MVAHAWDNAPKSILKLSIGVDCKKAEVKLLNIVGSRSLFSPTTSLFLIKAWFPLSQLRPRQRPISSQNIASSMKDCSTL